MNCTCTHDPRTLADAACPLHGVGSFLAAPAPDAGQASTEDETFTSKGMRWLAKDRDEWKQRAQAAEAERDELKLKVEALESELWDAYEEGY